MHTGQRCTLVIKCNEQLKWQVNSAPSLVCLNYTFLDASEVFSKGVPRYHVQGHFKPHRVKSSLPNYHMPAQPAVYSICYYKIPI